MISYLIDINVWLAMTWGMHPQHAAASRWDTTVGGSNESALLFCRMTDGALSLYDQWSGDPRVQLVSEPGRMDTRFREALAPVALQSAMKAIADCYLIGSGSSDTFGLSGLGGGLFHKNFQFSLPYVGQDFVQAALAVAF